FMPLLSSDNVDILLLQPRLTDADPGVRRIALIELADQEDPDALPWLIHALSRDENDDVRSEAARLLEGWEEAEVVAALCAALTDSSEEGREIAAQSLCQLKTPAAGRITLTCVEHPQASVRGRVLRALRELRLPQSAEAAASALGDPDAVVRREAVA